MKRRDGSALIAALLIMMVLVALAAAAGAVARLHLRTSRASVSALQRLYAAQAGVRLAEAVLRRDETAASDALDEEWATLGDAGQEARAIGDASFRVQIIDAGSRVNLNTATKEMLMRLPGLDDSLTDALLDWREEGETPRPAGAKADYYQSLETPYLPRGGTLETLGELLLVRDFTPALLFGPPAANGEGEEAITDLPLSELVTVFSQERNISADGEARRNLNTATEDELTQAAGGELTADLVQAILSYRQEHGQFESISDLLDVPGMGTQQMRALIDKVSVSAETVLPGRININTASAQVLATVPGITADVADTIVSTREGENGAFESIGDLLEPGLLEDDAFRQAAPYLCTRSAAFLVRVMGRVPDSPAVTAIEALVERTAEGTRVLRWARVERAPGWIAWGWPRTWPEVIEDSATSSTAASGSSTSP